MQKLLKKKRLIGIGLSSLGSLLLFIATASAVFAQAVGGTIKGTVTDQNGAVVPGATVVVKNQSTGVSSPAFRSTNDGLYLVPALIPGKYTLTVQSANFKTGVYTDIDVRLGEDSVIDVLLQPGGASETVTVTASTETTIQRDTSQVSSSFTSRQVQDLPSNVAGSGLDTLALLVPGVTPGFGNVNTNGTALSVNGNRGRSNNFTIDGQDNNDLSLGGPVFFVDNQDSVADYQVITNNFSAQYGRNQGAIINVVSKAGTNQFHGTGFWYHRDRSNFDSLDNFEKSEGLSGPKPLLYNVYGGTIGGPIKQDRIFFFGSYQGTQTREIFTAVPGLTEAPGLAILPEDLPALAAAFPGNAAIQNYVKFSPFAIQDLGTVSARPGTEDTVTLNGMQFRAAIPQRSFEAPTATPYSGNEFSTRIDTKLTDKDSLWGRYLFQQSNFKNGLGSAGGFTGDAPGRSQNVAVTWDRQLSSNSLNDLSFNYTHLTANAGGGCNGLTGCIPDPSQVDQAFTNISFPGVRGDNSGLPLLTVGPNNTFPQGRIVNVFQFRDNYSFVRGRHQFMAGIDIRRLTNSATFLPDINGQFQFRSAAQFVNNSPGLVTLGEGPSTVKYNETDQFYFFQDDWKIKDNLTLNLGIRYEFTGQPINTLHDLSVERESNPNTALWLQSLPLSARTVPKIPSDKNNFAPRIGFAYTPRFWKKIMGQDATVIRGGYSIAYDPSFYNILVNVSSTSPFVFLLPIVNPSTGSPLFPVPDNAFGPQVRALAANNGLIRTNTFDPRFFTQDVVSPNFHEPYSEQWSFGIERQLSHNNVVEARYLGTHGVGLFQNVLTNPYFGTILNGFTLNGMRFPGFPNLVPSGLTPQVAGVGSCVDNPATPNNEASVCNGRLMPAGVTVSRNNTGQSIYHSLQLRYNGRVAHQLTLGATYTFSKALDNASEIFAFQENSIAQDPFNIGNAERSYSGFDRRHQIAFNFIWDVPLFKEQKGLLGHVAGGWQLNGIYVIDSGLRYTPVQVFNGLFAPNYTDPIIGDTLKPFYGNPNADPTQVGITDVDAAILFGTPKSPTGFWSLNALNSGQLKAVTMNDVKYIENMPGAAARFGTPFGNVPRNSEVGPRINQFNVGIFKNTKVGERLTVQLRMEVFNALNHPNPGYGYLSAGLVSVPDNLIEDAGSTFNRRDQMEFVRRAVQLGLKLIF